VLNVVEFIEPLALQAVHALVEFVQGIAAVCVAVCAAVCVAVCFAVCVAVCVPVCAAARCSVFVQGMLCRTYCSPLREQCFEFCCV